MAKDPVCGMDVDEQNPNGGTAEYQGQTYYFCVQGCRQSFEKEPQRFLGGAAADPHAGHSH